MHDRAAFGPYDEQAQGRITPLGAGKGLTDKHCGEGAEGREREVAAVVHVGGSVRRRAVKIAIMAIPLAMIAAVCKAGAIDSTSNITRM